MASMKCPLQPAPGKIVVQRDTSDDKTKGGIVLPDVAKERPRQGLILAVGPEKLSIVNGMTTREPVRFGVGARVVFTNYAGNEVELGGEKYLVLSQDDVLATVVE